MTQAILIALALHYAFSRRYLPALACLAPGVFVAAYDWKDFGAYAVLLPVLFSLLLLALERSRRVLSAGRVVALALLASLAADACGASGIIHAGREAARGFYKGFTHASARCA